MPADNKDELEQPAADSGIAGVAAMISDADDGHSLQEKYLEAALTDPVPGHEREGVPAGQWKANEMGLPLDCPVVPLGTKEGNFFFLDTIGQMRVLSETSMGQSTINSLFMGRHHYLYWAWPQFDKKKNITGFKAEKTRERLMQACGYKGPFDPVVQTRGRGAWQGPDGQLIIHCGNTLIEDGKPVPLGEIGGRVYPTRPPIPLPWSKPLSNHKGPAADLLPLFKTWQWDRPEVDPILLLGWIGAAMLGGALDHRPAVFIVGDKATGKSTLQKILNNLFGRGLIQSADTTAAGIYQQLQYDSLPVAVDEFEAKSDSRRAKAILELARAAFSGDVMLRGGDSHKGVQFNARSSFLFSAINTPPLDPQDLSRQAILSLKRLPQGQEQPVMDAAKFRRLGRMCMRRLIDNWHRFPQTLATYYEALAAAGHGGRGQDTFGTLLACADMLIDTDAELLDVSMGADGETDRSYWGKQLKPSEMLEYEGADENWRNCLNHILSARIDAWRGGSRQTVGKVLSDYWEDHAEPLEGGMNFETARKMLQETGLSLHKPQMRQDGIQLFIPNNNPLLHQLFMGSKWQGTPEAGSWMVALRQAPNDTFKIGQGRVNGVKSKGTLFALKRILDVEEPEEADANA